MWRKRGRNSRTNSRTTDNAGGMMSSGQRMVGTQAKAAEHMQKNRELFHYPQGFRFVTPIEHSLLYSMVDEGPAVYPEKVVLSHIDEEDYSVYLPMVAINGTSSSRSSFRDSNDGYLRDNENYATNETEEYDKASYAQLSAILALSAEKYPPSDKEDSDSISKNLCKRILGCVVKYAQEHDLDREAEISELLRPVEEHSMKRNANAELRQAVPFYVGYAATLITANPIPMMIGWSVMASGNQKAEKEMKNLSSITKETERRSDVEKTSLLDETDF